MIDGPRPAVGKGLAVPVSLTPGLRPPPAEPLAVPPGRRPGSVRRTSSLDMSWPGGRGTPMHVLGRARDLATAVDGSTEVLAADELTAVIGLMRTIDEIAVDRPRPGIGRLVGARGGGGLRAAIDEAVPEDRAGHTPLALLLDDIAGASLVGGFAWSRHPGGMYGIMPATTAEGAPPPPPRRSMEGICAGFRPGSGALGTEGFGVGLQQVVQVPPLTDPDDPLGWHALGALAEVGLRRARRMDVWRDGDVHLLAAHFRDSMTDPVAGEVAVHEYVLEGVVDAGTMILTSLVASPRALPYAECPAAAPNVSRLVGLPLADLRVSVLEVLQGTDCCTHLNDALRALADVAALLPATR